MAEVSFWDDSNCSGAHTVVMTDTNMGESSSVELSYNSITTQAESWLVVWNEEKYTGDYLLVAPFTSLRDLNDVPRQGGGDWNDQIKCFQLFSQQPSWWNSGVPPRG